PRPGPRLAERALDDPPHRTRPVGRADPGGPARDPATIYRGARSSARRGRYDREAIREREAGGSGRAGLQGRRARGAAREAAVHGGGDRTTRGAVAAGRARGENRSLL